MNSYEVDFVSGAFTAVRNMVEIFDQPINIYAAGDHQSV